MRLTEAKIRQVIKEEIIGFLNEIAEAPKSEKIASITGDQVAMFIKADITTELKKGNYTPEVEKTLLERLTKIKETLKQFLLTLTAEQRQMIYKSNKNYISSAPTSGYFLYLVDPFSEEFKGFSIGRSKVEKDAFFSIAGIK